MSGCGTPGHACSCGGGSEDVAAALLPMVNGVLLAGSGERLSGDELRQRAHLELLRQEAIRCGLLDAADPAPREGAVSEAASAAIDTLLDREVRVPEPQDEACRRHHAGHAARYAVGEKVRLRHVLFAVTPGVDVAALRRRAEACLIDLRGRVRGEADRFAAAAADWSNCPSGEQGGDLGWLTAEACAPEFAREIFGHPEVGVLPRLVHSRFGLHVVEVLAREPGVVPPFEQVRGAVSQALRMQSYRTALRQYLQLLAGRATVEGVALDASGSPLVQ